MRRKLRGNERSFKRSGNRMDKSGRRRAGRRNGKRSVRLKKTQAKRNGKAKGAKQKGGTESGGGERGSQTRRKAKGQRQRQKGGTGSGGGAEAQTRRKGKAKRGRESSRSDTIKLNTISGGNGERVPPVPIPNTEVKPLSADGTWLETARESRSSPDSIKGVSHSTDTFSFYISEKDRQII